MTRLAGKCIVFLFVGCLVLAPVCLLLRHAHLGLLSDPAFSLGSGVSVLIAGDSHAEADIDPGVLPHAASIAHSGENYFYTYYKLRHFLLRNPQIDTVVLGFSWHNFPRRYQESFLFGDKTGSVALYFPLLDRAGREVVKSWKSAYLVPWGRFQAGLPLQIYRDRLLLRKLCGLSIRRGDFEYFGGFNGLAASQVNRTEIENKLRLYFSEESGGFSASSDLMEEYLEKIVALCASKGIRLVLFNGPLHQAFVEGIPNSVRDSFEQVRLRTVSRHDNVQYLDLSGYRLPDADFYDGDHLNRRGAAKVTGVLASSVNNAPR